jgi:hypothetical protein
MRIIIGNWKGDFNMFLIILVLFIVIIIHLGCSCSRLKKSDYYSMFSDVREGFANIGNTFAQVNQPPPNTKNWEQPNLTIAPDTPLPQGVIDILQRKGGKVPLPSDQKEMFLTTPFKPECCPNVYSNSSGCACMSLEQYEYLKDRGGNNTKNVENI